MIFTKWLVALVAGLAAGCAAQPPYNVQHLAGELPVGTRLEVVKPFTYPGGRTSLWFQSGEIKDSRQLSTRDWHCSLDLYVSRRSDQAREFDHGSFLITGIGEERLDRLFEWDEDYTLGVLLALAAPDHPAVRRLRCERLTQDWSHERPLTLAELRAALGRYFTIGAASR